MVPRHVERDSVPTISAALRFSAKAWVLRRVRSVRNLRSGLRRYVPGLPRDGEVLLGQSVSPLWPAGAAAGGAERRLTLGKVQNLRVALKRVDGVIVPAGRTFSFWKHVGRATPRSGYVQGRELREGCFVPSTGGGLCQLSNALYDAALRAGCEIVERHAHTTVVPGSLAEVGRDATVFWNYVDLRFRSDQHLRIEASLSADTLAVRLWGSGVAPAAPATDAVAVSPGIASAEPGCCASCDVAQCFRHISIARADDARTRTAFLVDAYWPEYDDYLAAHGERGDMLFTPVDGRRFGSANYRWDTSRVGDTRESRMLTLLRSLQSRRVARHGAARQRLLLRWAERMAISFAWRLPYDVSHVVVMQPLLPALAAGGYLGGRTYDVLMTGLPMRALQRALDEAFARHPESPTLHDFRADPRLVETEELALAGARQIITPHAGVAAAFGSRAVLLPWAIAPAVPVARSSSVQTARRTVVFPALTLGRAGAYELRDVARALDLHVLLCGGDDLEGPDFWNGVSVERRADYADALGEAAAVVLPAYVESQPRRLLLAAASGIPVIASDACGLGEHPRVATVPAGDMPALRVAVERLCGDDAAAAGILRNDVVELFDR